MDYFSPLSEVIKAVGEKPMIELAKNWWIKFCIGMAILAYPLAHLITAVLNVITKL
jgi:hypothetical protein